MLEPKLSRRPDAKMCIRDSGLTVPTTWEELAETSAKIQAITGKPAFGTDYPADMFITLTKQFGGDYTNVKGELLSLIHI